MEPPYFALLPSPFGPCSIVWQETEEGPQVQRVFLPTTRTSAEQRAQAAFADARPGSTPIIAALAERIRSFLEGEAITFGLELVAFERCTEFQRSVLIAEHTIPRGWVSTYGRIARRLGVVGGARAVGSALAKNPFPIIIPCHRAIQSGGALGGYQGGLEMKRALLELEGIEFSEAGKVLMRKVALA